MRRCRPRHRRPGGHGAQGRGRSHRASGAPRRMPRRPSSRPRRTPPAPASEAARGQRGAQQGQRHDQIACLPSCASSSTKALQAARTMVDTAQTIAQTDGRAQPRVCDGSPSRASTARRPGNATLSTIALRTMLQGGAMPKTDELSRAIDSADGRAGRQQLRLGGLSSRPTKRSWQPSWAPWRKVASEQLHRG